MRLLLIRHAQTTWNAAGRVQGQADPPLSPRGREQCSALARRMAGQQIDALHSSDLERARLTAAAVAGATGLAVQLEPGLREVGLGQWEGIDGKRLREEYPEQHRRWLAEPTWDIVPGGEGSAAFTERVMQTLSRLLKGRTDDATVALVTHIGVIRTVLSTVAGLQSRVLRWPWAIDNTGITTLLGPSDVGLWSTPALQIVAVNDADHLSGIGGPA